ncbi:MAG: bifunctional metallophosphatase/5'-nucleotidase [Deltaproteobacteria bacterium]|jgi:5'-nucleotidase / UDP-sugar diphosphatase|nr:bifunctional metallophosphatase/5'-nucleotidase [Deltaproteobacteria bacterium]MBT6436348.1 bifunctional metallophosphatase/5'-nucleotidase [Deltaproteobacteria bacterium]MBT6488371.1 bifunctional metallophosphatase/5'-nucleotidase [Deltaproteobacteria bacterium]
MRVFIFFILAFSMLSQSALAGQRFTVLHTNDWQSRVLGFGPNSEYTPQTVNDDKTIGGLARLATLIDQRRLEASQKGPVLLLDGGDFSMGTLFHTVTRETGMELQLMQAMGYDAAAVGNHEFDFKPQGFAAMIGAALKQTETLPKLLMSNVRFDHSAPEDDALQAYMESGILAREAIIEKGGLRFGIIGLMGTNAAEVAKDTAPLTFDKNTEVAHRMSYLLKNKHKVDVVILLSHGGILKAPSGNWIGEDFDLAEAAPEIDLVVGGHSHTPLKEPLLSKSGTPILQAGSDGRFLGEIEMELTPQGLKVINYTLHAIDDSIPGKPEITQLVDTVKQTISEKILKPRGYTFDQPIASTNKTLKRTFNDTTLGNLVTDAIRVAAGSDIAITGNGTIRDELHVGKSGIQTVSDLFRITPLGVGIFDNEAGYPLTKMYLNGRDLKGLFEVLLLAHTIKGPSYFPRFSGAIIDYNLFRMPFDRIVDIQIGSQKDGYRLIDLGDDSDELYSVGATSYVANFAWTIATLSKGVISITPKDKNGVPIQSIKGAVIDADPNLEGTQELKEWQALLHYVTALPDINQDGLADIEAAPGLDEERISVSNSFSPVALLKNASPIMWTTTLFACFLILGTFLYFIRLSFKFYEAIR